MALSATEMRKRPVGVRLLSWNAGTRRPMVLAGAIDSQIGPNGWFNIRTNMVTQAAALCHRHNTA